MHKDGARLHSPEFFYIYTFLCQYDLQQKHTEVIAEHENVTEICQIINFYHKALTLYGVYAGGKEYCD